MHCKMHLQGLTACVFLMHDFTAWRGACSINCVALSHSNVQVQTRYSGLLVEKSSSTQAFVYMLAELHVCSIHRG